SGVVLFSLKKCFSQEADCKNMVDTATKKFGRLHVAFNNAGAYRSSSFAQIDEGGIDEVLNTNVKSIAFCFKYQVQLLRELTGAYSKHS
ncbi:unnamed protein product, partial [Hapterophycus canaliculatus]